MSPSRFHRTGGIWVEGGEITHARISGVWEPLTVQIITDTFPEADGTNLNGKATTTGGKTWQVLGGTMNLLGNKARGTSGSVDSAVVDAGFANIDMSVDITVGDATTHIDGVLFRTIDLNNYFRVAINTVANQLIVLRNLAGVETSVNTGSAAIDPGQTGTMRVLTNGTSIQVFWNAVAIINFTHSSHLTATKHGIIENNTNTRFDNFSLQEAV